MLDVICIKCGRKGKVSGYTPTGGKRQYQVAHFDYPHEHKWGTALKESEQVQSYPRCYLHEPYQIAWAKELLGEVDVDAGTQTKLIF